MKKPEIAKYISHPSVQLVLWSALVVYSQLLLVRLFATYNGALSYYGNLILLSGICLTSMGFFMRRNPISRQYTFPLLALPLLAGYLLHHFNLIQVMELEFQWFNVANTSPKDYSMDMQLGAFLGILSFTPLCLFLGRCQHEALHGIEKAAMGYIWMGIGGIGGGLTFLFQNQCLSDPFSLVSIFVILACCVLIGQNIDRKWILINAACAILVLLGVFRWSTSHHWSPYQRIDFSQDDPDYFVVHSNDMFILVSFTIPASEVADSDREKFAAALYGIREGDRVLVLGAGTGTRDVREALRLGASHVTAVEIDSSFVDIGRATDPDKTYFDDRVEVIIDDARHFIATSHQTYDVILMNYLDSQTNASNQARFRLDSFLYTVEGLSEAMSLLSDDGYLAINHTSITRWMTARMAKTLASAGGVTNLSVFAFDMRRPHRLFIASKGRSIDFLPQQIHPAMVQEDDLEKIEIATDDWPFFYTMKRQIPDEHIRLLLLVGFYLSTVGFTVFYRPSSGDDGHHVQKSLSFYAAMSGAAFFFLQLRTISICTPLFGSTYLTQSIVVSTIIGISVVGSILGYKYQSISKVTSWLTLAMLLLIAYLSVPAFHPYGGMLPSRYLYVLVNLLPVGAAGYLFMCYIREAENTHTVAVMQRWNLIGGTIGAMLECLVIIIGFQQSLLVGCLFYALAYLFAEGKTVRQATHI